MRDWGIGEFEIGILQDGRMCNGRGDFSYGNSKEI